MKKHVRRVITPVVALAIALLGVLIVAHWDAIRDHLEAWHFQLTTDTITIEPINDERDMLWLIVRVDSLSFHAKCIVIGCRNQGVANDRQMSPQVMVDKTLSVLTAHGYRVIEQYFPRRTFVAIRTTLAVKSDSRGHWLLLSNGGN